MKEEIKRLQEMIDIQCSDGNWNYDPYMHGMANGMIFSMSLFTSGVPEYLGPPDEWLCDKPCDDVKAKEHIPEDPPLNDKSD